MENEQHTVWAHNDFRIGRPENHSHPLDDVSNEDLRDALRKTKLEAGLLEEIIVNKGKFQDLLMQIVEADKNGDAQRTYLLMDTLQVGLGKIDPRKKADDPETGDDEIPAHASRPWFNG